ncbi:MAG: redoxin domain-containing protein [Planctomycetes bacterium]|nr:redoxin domain-containing protein [Planctomycetota bacterium]
MIRCLIARAARILAPGAWTWMVLIWGLAIPLAADEKAPPPTQSEAEELYQKAMALFRKGQDAAEGRLAGERPEGPLGEAIVIFKDLLQRFPKEEKAADAAFKIGTSHLLLDEPEKARAAYKEVFDAYPQFKDRILALFRLAICQAALDRPKEAKATLEELIRKFPEQKDEIGKARKYLRELDLVGRPAPAVQAAKWIHGVAEKEGIKTFQGSVMVIFFFATWCPNCKKELPRFRRLMEKLAPEGVVFLGVANPDDPQNREAVEPYLQKSRLEFLDVALDPKEATWPPYRVSGFPAAALVDKKGIVRWRGHPAFLSKSLIDKLLKEKDRS